jgi:hypothetical protein
MTVAGVLAFGNRALRTGATLATRALTVQCRCERRLRVILLGLSGVAAFGRC